MKYPLRDSGGIFVGSIAILTYKDTGNVQILSRENSAKHVAISEMFERRE